MKAIVFTQYGPPEKLELKEVPKPAPGDDEVLVRIHASSINSWDWEYLSGVPYAYRLSSGLFRPKEGKQRLGADIAGIVEAVGKLVTRFKPGDEVFGDLWENWGGLAEYACTPETAVELKPTNISFEEAATIPQAGGLALQGLTQAGPIEPGMKVLINGAGGGVGTFAIQMAKLSGAEVTGVDAPHKLDVARSVGADQVIDYTAVDFAKTGERYDVILDCQSTRSFFTCKRALNQHGTYAMVGGRTSRIIQIALLGYLTSFTSETRELQLVLGEPNKCLAELKELAGSGKLKPVVDKVYTLTDAKKALRYFGDGQHKGKVVITMEN